MTGVAILAGREHWSALAGALEGWLPAQRWFQGKARRVTAVTVDDVVVLAGFRLGCEPPG